MVHGVNKFIIMVSNVDVFSQDKLRELKHRLQESNVNPHIIALQEVRPKNYRFERMLVEYSIDGYEMLEKNVINAGEGRGLLLYIRRNMSFIEINLKHQYCEYICLEVKGVNDTILIASVYRSPSSDVIENDKLLEVMQEFNNHQAKHKLFMGDFNLPNINWENCTTTAGSNSLEYKFIETTRDCFMIQHIKETTRHRGETRGSVIDLVFSSNEEIVNNIRVESPLGRSDHACITFTCDIGVEERTSKKTVYIYMKEQTMI